MVIEYADEDGPRSVFVPRSHAASVARVIADDVGHVRLNGDLVTGPASDGDRALFEQWQRGGPDAGGEGRP
jgi:hypothetical protein